MAILYMTSCQNGGFEWTVVNPARPTYPFNAVTLVIAPIGQKGKSFSRDSGALGLSKAGRT